MNPLYSNHAANSNHEHIDQSVYFPKRNSQESNQQSFRDSQSTNGGERCDSQSCFDPDELLDVRQMCELLKVCEKKLRTMYQEEGLPVVRLGRRVLFRRSDVRRWISSQSLNLPDDGSRFDQHPTERGLASDE